MKKYINPEIVMTSFVDEDILTASGDMADVLRNGGENGIAQDARYSQFFPGVKS